MTKNRLEAFSDGVFAIATTLLVLDVRLPETTIHSNQELYEELLQSGVSIATFIFSFLVIGVFWVAHNRIFLFIKHVDHFLLWANIFYLLTVAIIPFPASILAKHPFYIASVNFYSSALLLCGLQHFILIRYVYRHAPLRESNLTQPVYQRAMRVASVGPVCYLLAILTSFIHPVISFCFIVAALVFYIFIAQRFVPQAHKPQTFNKAT